MESGISVSGTANIPVSEEIQASVALKKGRTPQEKAALAGKIIGKIFFYLFLALLCVIVLFPVVWMIANSMKTKEEIDAAMNSFWTFLPSAHPENWFQAYGKMFTAYTYFARSIFNSFLYCGITILAMLVLNSLAGYALTRIVFPGHKVIVTIILLLLIVPVETSVVSTYVLLSGLGLTRGEASILGYLITGFVSPMYIFMFRSYFMGIPRELEEAAYIDGCGKLRTFFRVIVPCCKPVFATVAIFAFMGQWNEYVFAQLMFSGRQDLMPLQVFLQLVQKGTDASGDMSVTMAALTFGTIPIAIVYIFCQKYIVEGVAFSGLK